MSHEDVLPIAGILLVLYAFFLWLAYGVLVRRNIRRSLEKSIAVT